MRVFLTTIPKSGTKLMELVLHNLGLRKMTAGTVSDGGFVSGHDPYDPALFERHPDARFISLVRDPRDILISLEHFTGTGRAGRIAGRIPALARDRRELQALLAFGVLNRRLAQARDWHSDPRVLTVRFEDIVGDDLGGSAERRQALAERLGGWLGLASAETLKAMAAHRNTSTFRSGRIGAWRTELDPAVANEIEVLHGEDMIRLGYDLAVAGADGGSSGR